MNRKLIAAAVSAAVVAPVASQADVTVYGNITNALVSADDGTDSSTDIETVSSRLGVKASSDLGNGLSANGRFEWATGSDNASEAFGVTRIGSVGLSGSFGSVTLGQQWSSFFNTVGTLVSPNYTVGNGYDGHFRTGNTIQYTNSFGPLSFGLDIRVDDDVKSEITYDDMTDVFVLDSDRDAQGDGFGIGASFNPTDSIVVAVAYDTQDGESFEANDDAIGAAVALVNEEFEFDTNLTGDSVDSINVTNGDTDNVGIAIKGTFGGFWASVGHQSKTVDGVSVSGCATTGTSTPTCVSGTGEDVDTDSTQLWVGGSLSDKTNWNIGYGESEESQKGVEDKETENWAFALNHKMGGGLHLFLEWFDSTTEQKGAEDVDSDMAVLGMRINF